MTPEESNGWWRMKGEEFELYKIRKMAWVEVGSTRMEEMMGGIVQSQGAFKDTRVITKMEIPQVNRVMYITIGAFAPMSEDVFRAHFERQV